MSVRVLHRGSGPRVHMGQVSRIPSQEVTMSWSRPAGQSGWGVGFGPIIRGLLCIEERKTLKTGLELVVFD